MRYFLFIIYYFLFIIYYLLLIIYYLLFIIFLYTGVCLAHRVFQHRVQHLLFKTHCAAAARILGGHAVDVAETYDG